MAQRSIPIQVKSLLATIDKVSRKIPGCEPVRNTFCEFWVNGEGNSATEEDMTEMRRHLAHYVNGWLHDAKEKDIVRRVQSLPPVARKEIRELVRPQFKHFFESINKGLPTDFAAPSPFLVMERKAGNWFPLYKPLVRKWGEIKIEMLGTALKAEDGQLTHTLLFLLKRKKAEFTRKNIYFRTTRPEIAKAMCKKNSRDESTREAIWDGLKRLRACVMELTNARGFRTIGGILDGAMELEEDSAGEIGIYLDRNFVDLIDEGYVELEDEVYQKLSPREANLYKFLMSHNSFRKFGYLKIPMGIEKVYDAAGLCGLQTDTPTHIIRKRLKKALNGLQKALIKLESKHPVRNYSLKNDRLSISTKGLPVESVPEPESVPEMKRVPRPVPTESVGRCPHGHRFADDRDQFPECEDCVEWLSCSMRT